MAVASSTHGDKNINIEQTQVLTKAEGNSR